MTALEIIGMILLLFLLLSLLRVGAIVDFGGELRVRLRVGPVKLTVLPRKEKKAQKKAAEAAGKTPEEKTKPKAAGGHRLPKLSFPELRELAGTVLGALKRTLRRTCRRTRIDPLEVGVIFAGDDPADTAQTYGYANAALWTLMPKLEELFYIPKPSVWTSQRRRPRRRGRSAYRCACTTSLPFSLHWRRRWENGSCVGAGRTGARQKRSRRQSTRLCRKRMNRKNGLHRKEDHDGEQGKKFGKRADGDYDDEDPRNGGFQFRHR